MQHNIDAFLAASQQYLQPKAPSNTGDNAQAS
jgi:hypothetical protein